MHALPDVNDAPCVCDVDIVVVVGTIENKILLVIIIIHVIMKVVMIWYI